MAKGNRGGKRAASKNTGPTTPLDDFRKSGVRFGTGADDVSQLDQKAVNETLAGVRDVLTDMGLPLSTVTSIEAHASAITGKGSKDAMASANGFRQLSLMKGSYSKYEQINDNGGFTIGGSNYYATGAHEAGHIVSRYITEQKYKNESILTVAKKYKAHTVQKEIIKNAQKSFTGKKVISKYAGTNFSEAVSEAFADVHYNKSKASDYSKAIVNSAKDLLKRYS